MAPKEKPARGGLCGIVTARRYGGALSSEDGAGVA